VRKWLPKSGLIDGANLHFWIVGTKPFDCVDGRPASASPLLGGNGFPSRMLVMKRPMLGGRVVLRQTRGPTEEA
jgi:hypothetical protein